MFSEQEVFAKIGFLVMAFERSQRENQQLSQALREAQKTEETTPENDPATEEVKTEE